MDLFSEVINSVNDQNGMIYNKHIGKTKDYSIKLVYNMDFKSHLHQPKPQVEILSFSKHLQGINKIQKNNNHQKYHRGLVG